MLNFSASLHVIHIRSKVNGTLLRTYVKATMAALTEVDVEAETAKRNMFSLLSLPSLLSSRTVVSESKISTRFKG